MQAMIPSELKNVKYSGGLLTHFIRETTRGVSDIFGNNSINNENIEKYLTESCSEDANDQFFLNLFIKC